MTGSEKILLVDNSRVSLMLQETVLRRSDNKVTAVTSGAEAWSLIQADHPRLVIFGFDLGEMTGPDLCRNVRESDSVRATSLLFIGDRHAEQYADLCMNAGCNDYLFRPFHRRELDLKVEKLIRIPVRRDLRTLTRLEVAIDREGSHLLGHSVNVSASGILLQTGHALPANAEVRVNFFLPGDPAPVNVRAEVTRAEFVGVEPRFGLRFVDVDPETRERINRFVDRGHPREPS